jgi:N-acetylglucosaminyldiphosphoundecaprenol N-acetyl-beta-D-mannosaminyltransferase
MIESRTGPPAISILSSKIHPVSFKDWIEALDRHIRRGDRQITSSSHNLHSLHLAATDPEFGSLYRDCDLIYIDGTPVRWLCALGGTRLPSASRFSLMDRFPDLLSEATTRGWRVFYLGGSRKSLERGLERARREHASLRIEGAPGYFDLDGPEDGEVRVRARVNAFSPDLLLVGMGMPRQERWIVRNRRKVDAGVITVAGGTIDYYSGARPRPPSWSGPIGLSWAFRLVHQPRRLGRRYLIEPWLLLPRIMRQILERRP